MSSTLSAENEELIDLVWHDSRRRIVNEILNDELIPVPSLSAADNFGLFSVFAKSKPVSSCI